MTLSASTYSVNKIYRLLRNAKELSCSEASDDLQCEEGRLPIERTCPPTKQENLSQVIYVPLEVPSLLVPKAFLIYFELSKRSENVVLFLLLWRR
jgi:hypothetical protein